VKIITDGIKQKRPADAICAAVEKIADLLKTHFPIKPGDIDELENVIIDK
jgi:putative membrane protein